MNRLAVVTLALLGLTLVPVGLVAAEDEPDEKELAEYKEVDYRLVAAAPEKYKNDKVQFTGRYTGFSTTFLPYMEESGIKASDYIAVLITDLKVPAIARKSRNRGLDEQIAVLPRGADIRLYGKIKKFREKPHLTTLPHYYLELVHVEVIGDAAPAPAERGDRPRPR